MFPRPNLTVGGLVPTIASLGALERNGEHTFTGDVWESTEALERAQSGICSLSRQTYESTGWGTRN